MIKTIVVGLDGSEKSFHALAGAFELAKQLGVGVETVSAEDLPRFSDTIDELTEEKEIEDSRFREAIARARNEARKAGVSLKSRILCGHNTAKTISRFLAEHKADLFVIGTMEHGAAYEALTNSTCIALIRNSPCPVLIIK
jgi:nucleotide-binding universal stress UspA family protein